MKNINFGRSILKDRAWQDLATDEVLSEAKTLLSGWMNGEHSLERPKLYDHYALLMVALVDKIAELEQELKELKERM